jgi:hypothetical protein
LETKGTNVSFKPTSRFTIEMTPEQIRRYHQQAFNGVKPPSSSIYGDEEYSKPRHKTDVGIRLVRSLAAALAVRNAERADLVFEKPDFTKRHEGPEALLRAMVLSHELQNAFERIYPGQTVFHPTFR